MTIEIGSFLLLRFGNGTQVCQVIGETKTKYRVRRFNKSDALWVHTGSVIGKDDKRILGTCAVSYPGSKIPTPPSFAETVAILRQAAAECEARAKKFAERAESLPEDHPVKYERVNLRSSAKEQSRKAELHRKAAREYERKIWTVVVRFTDVGVNGAAEKIPGPLTYEHLAPKAAFKRLASRLLDGMAQTAADGDRSGFKGGPQFSWSAYVVGPAPENKRYSYQELKAYVEELDAARD